MKRSLPTAQARGRASAGPHAGSIPPPVERETPSQHVISVAQATTGAAASVFAAQLVAALVAEGIAVAALVTTDDVHADAQAALAALVDAGARDSAWVRIPRDAAKAALARALVRFAPDAWVVVLGNALPILYHPLFCALVSTPHSTHLPDARVLAPLTELQVSAPTAKLASEIAKLLVQRVREAG